MDVRRWVIVGWWLGSCATVSVAQDDSTELVTDDRLPRQEQKISLTGYVKLLNTVAIPASDDPWLFDNFIHHRLNFRWYLSDHLTIKVEARARFFFGQSNQVNPQFAEQVNTSLDYLVLGGEVVKSSSYLLNAFIDRASLDWYQGRWQVIVGKQRINWSKSYVWNPNDIFNAYSFFDFDYEERRGTDAILVKYNTGISSSLEVASNVEGDVDLVTIAAKYNLSQAGYDFQFLGGKYQTDVMAGVGWAGQIKGAGFKGEISYFYPYQFGNVQSTLVADVSANYYFSSTLNVRLEAIYNSHPRKPPGNLFFLQPVTAKELTFNHYSVFASVGYNITPLINANINGIWYADDPSFFVNPTVNFNLSGNTEFLLAAQLFGGTSASTFGKVGSYVFTRLKWNF